jgi:hypothetical protein
LRQQVKQLSIEQAPAQILPVAHTPGLNADAFDYIVGFVHLGCILILLKSYL